VKKPKEKSNKPPRKPTTFGEMIAYLRTQKGLKQAELAGMVGSIAGSTISRIELGGVIPAEETARRILDRLTSDEKIKKDAMLLFTLIKPEAAPYKVSGKLLLDIITDLGINQSLLANHIDKTISAVQRIIAGNITPPGPMMKSIVKFLLNRGAKSEDVKKLRITRWKELILNNEQFADASIAERKRMIQCVSTILEKIR
jgi:transcriptional regulator with XRE-family HTH domain